MLRSGALMRPCMISRGVIRNRYEYQEAQIDGRKDGKCGTQCPWHNPSKYRTRPFNGAHGHVEQGRFRSTTCMATTSSMAALVSARSAVAATDVKFLGRATGFALEMQPSGLARRSIPVSSDVRPTNHSSCVKEKPRASKGTLVILLGTELH